MFKLIKKNKEKILNIVVFLIEVILLFFILYGMYGVVISKL